MPAKSKSQFRYMQAICHGSIDPPEGMTKEQACEYVKNQHNYKDLPKSAHQELAFANNNLSDPTNPADEMEAMEGANEDAEILVPVQKNSPVVIPKEDMDHLRPPAGTPGRSSHMELIDERSKLY